VGGETEGELAAVVLEEGGIIASLSFSLYKGFRMVSREGPWLCPLVGSVKGGGDGEEGDPLGGEGGAQNPPLFSLLFLFLSLTPLSAAAPQFVGQRGPNEGTGNKQLLWMSRGGSSLFR